MNRPSHSTVIGICVVVVVALVVYAIVGAFGWLVHPLGSCTGNAPLVARCKGYNFWSGIGSDLGEVTLLTAVVAAYWHHTCHVTRCWRLGRFAHGHLKLCAHHHPLVPNNGRITKAEVDAVVAASGPRSPGALPGAVESA